MQWPPTWSAKVEYYIVLEPGSERWQGVAVPYDTNGGFAFYLYTNGQWTRDNTLESNFVGGDGRIVPVNQSQAEKAGLVIVGSDGNPKVPAA